MSGQKSWGYDYGLRDQIRRAMVSVSANIVEGFEKNTNKEFIRYLRIAKGSIGEVRNHFYVAESLGYISNKEFNVVNQELLTVAKQIGGFINYLRKFRYQE